MIRNRCIRWIEELMEEISPAFDQIKPPCQIVDDAVAGMTCYRRFAVRRNYSLIQCRDKTSVGLVLVLIFDLEFLPKSSRLSPESFLPASSGPLWLEEYR